MIRKNKEELHYFFGAVMAIMEADGADRELAALCAIGKRLEIDPKHREYALGYRSVRFRVKRNLDDYRAKKQKRQEEEARLEAAQQNALRPYAV